MKVCRVGESKGRAHLLLTTRALAPLFRLRALSLHLRSSLAGFTCGLHLRASLAGFTCSRLVTACEVGIKGM
jgi:hypothetical protein